MRRSSCRPFAPADSNTVARYADDGRYWFFWKCRGRPVAHWFLTPDHLFFMAAAVLLCYWLALHLTSPVRDAAEGGGAVRAAAI